MVQQLGPVLLDILDGFDPTAEPDVLPEDIAAVKSCYTSLVAVVALAGASTSTYLHCFCCFERYDIDVLPEDIDAVKSCYTSLVAVVALVGSRCSFMLQESDMVCDVLPEDVDAVKSCYTSLVAVVALAGGLVIPLLFVNRNI
jgi:hypothetical protein